MAWENVQAFRKQFDAGIKLLMGGSPIKSRRQLEWEAQRRAQCRRRDQALWETQEARRVAWRKRALVWTASLLSIPTLAALFLLIAALWQGAFR